MNLSTDKWIPVVRHDGRHDKVSLTEVFQQGDQIADLSVRPHERIALMRLLICIAQAALDGPKNRQEWRACKQRLPESALAYLKKWQHAFELFGDGPRFLQARGSGNPKPAEMLKIDFVDEDMTTLFDQYVTPGAQRPDDWIALHLLTYQSFAAGGKVGGSAIATKGKKKGKLAPQEGKNAPCRDGSAFHTFVRKSHLLDTIHANLCAKDQIARSVLLWGRPIWEYNAIGIQDFSSDEDLPRSYLGRLAPLSRAIWLHEERGFGSLHANGIEHANFGDNQVRDTTTAVRIGRDEERVLVSAATAEGVKRPWRELHALVIKGVADNGVGGPMVLEHLDSTEPFDLWIGAVVTSKAKIEDIVESVFAQLPTALLDSVVQKAYENGVKLANRVETRLRKAIATYRLAMETPESSLAKIEARYARLRKSDKQRLGNIAEKAQSLFWTLTETRLNLLLRFAVEPLPIKDGKPHPFATDWGKSLWNVARTSYSAACPQETPRQLRAYAMGAEALFGSPEKDEEISE